MKEKSAIILFIIGCIVVLASLALKQFNVLADYTFVFVGIVIESFSVLMFAYQKIKKQKNNG